MKITIHFTDGTTATYTGCSGYNSTSDRLSFTYTNPDGEQVEFVGNWANIKFITKVAIS